MFELGWSEIALIAVVLLVVIGPKELPTVMRATGRWVGKARRMAGDFQRQLEQMADDSGLSEVKTDLERIRRMDVNTAMKNAVDPTGEISKGLEIPETDAVLPLEKEVKPSTETKA